MKSHVALALVCLVLGAARADEPKKDPAATLVETHLKTLHDKQVELLGQIKKANDSRDAWNKRQGEVSQLVMGIIPELERVAGKDGFRKEFAEARMAALKVLKDLEAKQEIRGIQDFAEFTGRIGKITDTNRDHREADEVKDAYADVYNTGKKAKQDPTRTDAVTLKKDAGKTTAGFTSRPATAPDSFQSIQTQIQDLQKARASCPAPSVLRGQIRETKDTLTQIETWLAANGNGGKKSSYAQTIKDGEAELKKLRDELVAKLRDPKTAPFGLKVLYLGDPKKKDEFKPAQDKFIDEFYQRIATGLLALPPGDPVIDEIKDKNNAWQKRYDDAYGDGDNIGRIRILRDNVRNDLIKTLFRDGGKKNGGSFFPGLANFMDKSAEKVGVLHGASMLGWDGMGWMMLDRFNKILDEMGDSQKAYRAAQTRVLEAQQKQNEIASWEYSLKSYQQHLASLTTCDTELANIDAEVMKIRPHAIKDLGPGLEDAKGLSKDDAHALDQAKKKYEELSKKAPK